jgi:hypothetical protein
MFSVVVPHVLLRVLAVLRAVLGVSACLSARVLLLLHAYLQVLAVLHAVLGHTGAVPLHPR